MFGASSRYSRMLPKRLESFFKRYFLTQKKTENSGYVFNTAQHFLYGLTVYKKKTRLAIPIEFILSVGTMELFLSLLQSIIDFTKTNWIEVFSFYISVMTSIICSISILKHRERIRKLSDGVDAWWNYPFLQKETEKMKKRAEAWMSKFNYYYFAVMYAGAACCGVLPFQKDKFLSEKLEPMDQLMVPMWMPFSIEGTVGFVAASSIQILSMWFAFFTFGRTCSYLMCVSTTITYQIKLIEIACLTCEERVGKIVKEKILKDPISGEQECIEYREALKKEINSCIIHYQKLYSHVQEMCKAFSMITNLTYHAGMWSMCLLGVRIVRENGNPYSNIQAASAIVSLFINQYLYSHVSEALTDEVVELRFALYNSKWYKLPQHLKKNIHLFQTLLLHIPTLRTVMGTKTNMENLCQILNASYCYISMILSFKSKF